MFPSPDQAYPISLYYLAGQPTITDDIPSMLPVDYDEAIMLRGAYTLFLSVQKADIASQYRAEYNDIVRRLRLKYWANSDQLQYM